ncbi:FAD/NAD(P)-binding protein [Thermobispora bispora]|jgi:anaerobic sulfite reductase subunit B|uniref:Oxidoreductase FAD/NAD(P)-binding domain protein n=1 Tax=Thermobispora bispora (strain ATCC 19993 / DSM 43833 / CBS 139.67 / JCM 10125 / KCTC 9307 / NBRC 14880 / R51) TaxID=469371 RepID=D6YBL2_THEBD|nr:FAD/NAD(P)-binding protein [Thermobispora bispora]ADG88572.1 oxidoreductase FAD/NAD(P)-binding domain protein [Thermobispora bispora DSM 43833]MBO2475020.1 oxidoreductase [Actinomycetales bacterium]MBX6166605.1 FAD/NAD(P)-binding protein [Thermobispora bispora]MDI9581609.1 FAD/NAD(P)-binding protein [Thermobispora sp.]
MTPIPATEPPAPRSGPHPLTPVPYRVRSRVAERSDTVTLTLTPVTGACPPFTPGQFTMLYAPGVGEIPVSISGRARSGGLVQTIRAVGAVSTALCRMRPGDLVGVRGPYGTGFDLTAAAGRDVVVAAGGLGLAPLRPVIRELAAHRSRYGRVSVIVGAQVPKTLLYPRELDRWRDRHGIDVRVTVDHPDEGWTGHVGLVTRLLDRIVYEPRDTHAFVCGPEPMMYATAEELVRRGVAPERVSLSLERNMKCGVGRCGHCQLGPYFICLDGPVLPYDRVARLLTVREL